MGWVGGKYQPKGGIGKPGWVSERTAGPDRKKCHLQALERGVKRFSNWFVSATRKCMNPLTVDLICLAMIMRQDESAKMNMGSINH